MGLRVGLRVDRMEGPKADRSVGRWEGQREGQRGDPKADRSADHWEVLREGRWEAQRVEPKEGRSGVQMADLPMRLQAWTEALVESQPPQRGRARVEAWGLFLLPSAWASAGRARGQPPEQMLLGRAERRLIESVAAEDR